MANPERLLTENYILFVILIGILLVSLPIGPYSTPDTDLEFTTAQGVIKTGYPTINIYGTIIDEPPLDFTLRRYF
jgi:hypothetical protein